MIGSISFFNLQITLQMRMLFNPNKLILEVGKKCIKNFRNKSTIEKYSFKLNSCNVKIKIKYLIISFFAIRANKDIMLLAPFVSYLFKKIRRND